jgi:hypothetical protein
MKAIRAFQIVTLQRFCVKFCIKTSQKIVAVEQFEMHGLPPFPK